MKRISRGLLVVLLTAVLLAVASNASAATIATVVDVMAPMTSSDVQPTYIDSAMIMLTATDDVGGSGVAHTYYTVDGGAQTEGTEIIVMTPGMHDLTFWSVDNAGNVENPVMTAMFTINSGVPTDMIAPMTMSNAVSTYLGRVAKITFEATDTGGSGMAHTHYRLDGGLESIGSSVTVAAPGLHDLTYWSVDNAGNIENPAMTATFTVVVQTSRVSIKSSTTSPRYGRAFTLSGKLFPGSSAYKVKLFVKKPGATSFVLLSTRSVNSTGGWSYRYTPRKKGTFQFRTKFSGAQLVRASTSSILKLRVR